MQGLQVQFGYAKRPKVKVTPVGEYERNLEMFLTLPEPIEPLKLPMAAT